MELEINEENGKDIQIAASIPEDLKRLLVSIANPVLLHGYGFHLLFQKFTGTGFIAWYSHSSATDKTILRARGDMPMLELRIALNNSFQGTWKEIANATLKPYHFNFSFTSEVETRAVLDENQSYATFDIHFEFSFLEKLGLDFKTLFQFLEKVNKGRAAELSEFPHPCPLEMEQAINSILHSRYSLVSQQRMLEGKMLDIIMIALETVASPGKPVPIHLSNKDIEGLYAVRKHIKDCYPKWPDYASLCRKGELNTFKLKIGFKHLFSQTVYEYHMELKFQDAQRLLLEGKETIEGIAFMVGYGHVSTFSKEFKNRFGRTPSEFMRKRKP